MAFYYCNCSKENPNKNSNKIRRVKVDENGICLTCGYYAIACTKQVNSGHELTKILRLDKEDVDNMYLGSGVIHDAIDRQEELEGSGKKYNNYSL